MEGPNGVTIVLVDETAPAGHVHPRPDGPGPHVALIRRASMIARSRLAPFSLAVTAVFAIASTVLLILGPGQPVRDDLFGGLGGASFVALSLSFAVVGAIVAARVPGNPIGWIFCITGLLTGLGQAAYGYASFGLHASAGPLPGAVAATWIQAVVGPMVAALLVVSLLYFPDGRLPSSRWRWAAVVTALGIAAISLGAGIRPGNFDDPFATASNPLGVAGSRDITEAMDRFGWALVWIGIVLAAVSTRLRLRRSAGIESQQLKWVLAVGAVVALATITAMGSWFIWPDGGLQARMAVIGVGFSLFPAAVGSAILRYRFYDIDVVINRALVYGALTGCVVAVYVAVVGGLNSFIDSRGALGLVATGIVAAGVQPLRVRLQARVNRLVYGDRDDPYVGLSRLGDRLQATLAPELVTASIVEAVAEALRVSFVAIEFELDGEFEVVAAHGTERGGEKASTSLAYQGQTIGRLVVAPPPGRELSAADRRLLADLALHAGVALHGVRLTADLQRSRERLVSTREEERRRLRRDLHDSLGPTLAGMAFTLDAARNLIDTDPEEASRVIAGLRQETQEAIGDIRRVAHELRPPALDELGFVPAIRTHAERLSANGSRLDVRVEAPEPFPALPAAAEVAGYRIVLEALTNVARHADARACRVGLAVDRHELRIEVADDGVGLEAAREAGVGLTSMGERAAELGGRLEIGPRDGAGTRVTAALPIEEGGS